MKRTLTYSIAALAVVTLAGCSNFPYLNKKSAEPATATQAASHKGIDHAFVPPSELKPAAGESSAPDQLAKQTPIDHVISQVHTGEFLCAGKMIVNVEPAPGNPREFVVSGKGFRHTVVPVISHSGAVRLEDKPEGMFWLQVRDRAMLISQKLGRRLAAECVYQNRPAHLFPSEHKHEHEHRHEHRHEHERKHEHEHKRDEHAHKHEHEKAQHEHAKKTAQHEHAQKTTQH